MLLLSPYSSELAGWYNIYLSRGYGPYASQAQMFGLEVKIEKGVMNGMFKNSKYGSLMVPQFDLPLPLLRRHSAESPLPSMIVDLPGVAHPACDCWVNYFQL